ncbi:MAG: tripartite tricarboxylate transporter substrate binding protein [Acetobacteraceae bacterium]|nr:tripartite tricarboxylate transporter substrate binding protein [Acetobacteraceae bacterium]
MPDFVLPRRALGLGTLAALAAPAAAPRAQTAAAWPTRPLRWLVGYPPGGATDVIVRLLANTMGPHFPQPIVVDNRPGAGASIAAEALAKSPPDGATAMSVDMGVMVYNRALYKRLPYDPVREMAPVALYARFPFMLAVHPSVPARDAREFVALCKARPGQVTMASVGIGSPHHLGIERFRRRLDHNVVHVPYRGGAPMANDLAAGVVQAAFLDYTSGAAAYQGNRVRAVAACTAERVQLLPDAPTLAEQGYPGLQLYSWQGAVIPAATPAPVLDRFRALIADAAATEEVGRRMQELGAERLPVTAAEFGRVMAQEEAQWLPLIRDLGISLDT